MTDTVGRSVARLARRNRRAWLARRRQGVTATDVPAILGLSPWRTPLDVWLDKTGQAPPIQESYAMRRGTLLEALLLTEYATRTKATMLHVPPLSAHPDDPIALASLDGAAVLPDGETRVVEVKTVGWRSRDVWWDETRQIPDNYLAQCAWQSYVTGLPVDVIADVAGEVRILPTLPRSPEWEAYAVPFVHEWWERHVVGRVAPDPDPVADYTSMNLLWRPDPTEVMECDTDTHTEVTAYQMLALEISDMKKQQDVLRGGIRMAMMTATKLLDPFTGAVMASIDKRGALRITQPKDDA